MPCYHPISGFRSRFVNKTGKRSIVFSAADGYVDMPVTVPCGSCIGCRLEYSRQWAIRCVHEAQLHEKTAFITLTYNEDHLPEDHSIHKEHIQKFFKRLRKKIKKKSVTSLVANTEQKTTVPTITQLSSAGISQIKSFIAKLKQETFYILHNNWKQPGAWALPLSET